MSDVDWTDPFLYDLAIDTGAVGVTAAVGQVLGLVAAPEFQPTMASRQLMADRILAARVRAILNATPVTAHVELDIQAAGGTCGWPGWPDRRRRGTRRSPSCGRWPEWPGYRTR